MQFQIPIQIKTLAPSITYKHGILLTGSCFTEHIGNYLADVKLNVLQNPNGILFDPLSVCNSLVSYIQKTHYTEDDLFYLNECWHSWQHHSRFSGLEKKLVIANINESQTVAHQFLQQADWLIITLGSSYVYKLMDGLKPVANCHKAPAQKFQKYMLTIDEIIAAFDDTISQLLQFNPKLKIIFTISPVRHLRDGVTENNRSKARLIEAVHNLVTKFNQLYYFPSYELVIDVLRDYRFYDIDMAHPNYAATQFVLEKFTENCMDEPTRRLMDEIKKVVIARNHKAFNPQSQKHKQFLRDQLNKVNLLQEAHPYLDFTEELKYFSNNN